MRRDTVLYAVTAAVLAVLAALGSLLSGHEANQAILHQSKATDQWAYFQSKSTKGQVYEMGRELIQALSEAQGITDKTSSALGRFRERIDKYEKEKEEPQQEARRLEEESELDFKKHHHFALGVARLVGRALRHNGLPQFRRHSHHQTRPQSANRNPLGILVD